MNTQFSCGKPYGRTTSKTITMNTDNLQSERSAYVLHHSRAHTWTRQDQVFQVLLSDSQFQGQSWRLGSGSNHLVTGSWGDRHRRAPRLCLMLPFPGDVTKVQANAGAS